MVSKDEAMARLRALELQLGVTTPARSTVRRALPRNMPQVELVKRLKALQTMVETYAPDDGTRS
jgi:hypothetical protein